MMLSVMLRLMSLPEPEDMPYHNPHRGCFAQQQIGPLHFRLGSKPVFGGSGAQVRFPSHCD